MIEINVTVNCPDLLIAAKLLSSALRNSGNHIAENKAVPNDSASLTVEPTPAAVPTQAPVAVNPVSSGYSLAQHTPSHPSAPLSTAAAVASTYEAGAPISPAPSITLDQLATAGASLIRQDDSKRAALMGLLQQFGVQSVMQLKPDQIGAFATAMRRLGANI